MLLDVHAQCKEELIIKRVSKKNQCNEKKVMSGEFYDNMDAGSANQ